MCNMVVNSYWTEQDIANGLNAILGAPPCMHLIDIRMIKSVQSTKINFMRK